MERWEVVANKYYEDLMRAVMTGNAIEAFYTAGQLGICDPNDCDCEINYRNCGEAYRKQFDGIPDDHWEKWVHRNHVVHNTTVWRICNSARPGFISEIAAVLHGDMAKENPFFTYEWMKAMLDGFFNEDPAWLGSYRPSAKAVA